MNRAALREALHADGQADVEDTCLAQSRAEAGADIVGTRNEQAVTGSPLMPHRLETLLRMLRQ